MIPMASIQKKAAYMRSTLVSVLPERKASTIQHKCGKAMPSS